MFCDCKCDICGNIEVDVLIRSHHEEEDRPQCCGQPMKNIIGRPAFHFADGTGTDMGGLWRYSGDNGNKLPQC